MITVGGAVLERPSDDAGYWLVLVGGLVLAGALWWIYFTSAAEIYERLLGLSGGNPAFAYSLYAGGHVPPAFGRRRRRRGRLGPPPSARPDRRHAGGVSSASARKAMTQIPYAAGRAALA